MAPDDGLTIRPVVLHVRVRRAGAEVPPRGAVACAWTPLHPPLLRRARTVCAPRWLSEGAGDTQRKKRMVDGQRRTSRRTSPDGDQRRTGRVRGSWPGVLRSGGNCSWLERARSSSDAFMLCYPLSVEMTDKDWEEAEKSVMSKAEREEDEWKPPPPPKVRTGYGRLY